MRTLFLCSVIIAASYASPAQKAESVGVAIFRAQGVMHVQEYAPDGSLVRRDPKEIARVAKALDPTVTPPVYPSTVPFLVGVSNDWWYMRVHFSSNEWHEYGCDGQDTFVISHFPQVRGAEMAGVSAGVVPQHMDMEVGVLWLALCSGGFFSKGENHELAAPWAEPTMDPFAHVYELKGNFTNEEYRLPAFVWFEVAERRLQQAAQHPQLWPPKVLKEDVARLARLMPGSTGAVYRAWDWRPVSGIMVPSRFELEIMYRRWRGDYGQRPLGDGGVFPSIHWFHH
ncbi:MAG: hypothetical protein KatS3mg132_459 [Limisphaera sp.]|nr:MAG: hypothetical protein KatS3mg132_459 [Limisphaera sp.]